MNTIGDEAVEVIEYIYATEEAQPRPNQKMAEDIMFVFSTIPGVLRVLTRMVWHKIRRGWMA